MMVLRCVLKLSENNWARWKETESLLQNVLLPWHLHLTMEYGLKFHPANVSFSLKDKENAVNPPLTTVSFSAVSVTCGQWQSENRREITHHSQLAWWHLSLLTSSCQGSPTINIVCFRHPAIDIIMAPWSRVTQSRRASLWLIIRRSIVA